MHKNNTKNKTDKLWNVFLQTGKVEDFLNYRRSLNYQETNTNIEIGKIGKIEDKK
jgi:hypothetical protein